MWFLAEKTLRELREFRANLVLNADMIAAAKAWEQEQERSAADEPRILRRSGREALITIDGVLTNRRSFFMSLFGGSTSYRDIQESLAIAQADDSINKILLIVDSPGGHVNGLFETLADLQAVTKPMVVRATQAQSAAYSIAAVAGRIEATSPASAIGSVGVAVDTMVFPEDVSITNTDSPDKRPDLRTEEGKAVLQRELDALFGLFADAIATGRSKQTGKSVTVDEVKKSYGRGATLIAVDARKLGMIDFVQGKSMLRAVTRIGATNDQDDDESDDDQPAEESAGGDKPAAEGGQEKETMDLKKFKAEHPAVYQEAIAEAVAEAVKKALGDERDRVGAHLEMGAQSGDMKTAIEAIKSGDGMTQTLTAKYLSAGMNRADKGARQKESDETNRATGGTTGAGDTTTGDIGDAVVALLDKDRPKKA